jgi:hypothetical protein
LFRFLYSLIFTKQDAVSLPQRSFLHCSSGINTKLFRELTSLFFTGQDAVSLPQRPFLHCSSLPLVLFPLLLVWRGLTGNLLRFGLLLFSSLFSHHLRDATRRGLWFIGNVFFLKREN